MRHVITSALPYVNGIKHLGNLIGSLLPADVYARYLRLKGEDVIFICGTDDHGTPAELAAMNAGIEIEKFVKGQYISQKKIYDGFGLSFDFFGQTSNKHNHEITQSIFLSLLKHGFIIEKSDRQLYSIQDGRFLPDRYTVGTCPECGNENARGDQCDSCSRLLHPTELINPRSKISGSKELEVRETKHLYINLEKIQPLVEKWIQEQNHWPKTSISVAKKWLKEGLKPRAITRDLKWGIQVPLDDYSDKVFYVWFDAPIGYIGLTKQWAESIDKADIWEEYWKNPETKLTQFMGVDNVPFHSILWPCSLIGSKEGYILPHHIKGFQMLTHEGEKFSTSDKRGIFTDQALNIYPADYWRYYLLSIAPERHETDFQWSKLQDAVNNDLNNLLGNLFNRVVTFCSKHFEGKIPSTGNENKEEKELWETVESLIAEYDNQFSLVEFQKPVKILRRLLQTLNKYFQDAQPWKLVRADKDATKMVIGTLAHTLRVVAILFTPIIPFSAEKMFKILGIGSSIHAERWNGLVEKDCLVGNEVYQSGTLFTKITDKELAEKRERIEVESPGAKKKSEKSKASKKPKHSKLIAYDDFAKVMLKTVTVLEVEAHPDADELLILTVDDGKRKDRKICAGIKKAYSSEELVGRNVIIVDNLKPRKLRGVLSEGMVLAAEDAGSVSLLQTDKSVSPGLKVR